jgi:nicotinate phosphoribosyltransferase
MYQGADVIALKTEQEIDIMHHPSEQLKSLSIKNYKKEPVLHKVMEQGKRIFSRQSLADVAQFSQQCFDKLPMEYKRFINPHIYKIGLSSELKTRRDELISLYRAEGI